jgi:hypothetical protein
LDPITIYLVTADILRDGSLYVDDIADRPGLNRLERGRNAYRSGGSRPP